MFTYNVDRDIPLNDGEAEMTSDITAAYGWASPEQFEKRYEPRTWGVIPTIPENENVLKLAVHDVGVVVLTESCRRLLVRVTLRDIFSKKGCDKRLHRV